MVSCRSLTADSPWTSSSYSRCKTRTCSSCWKGTRRMMMNSWGRRSAPWSRRMLAINNRDRWIRPQVSTSYPVFCKGRSKYLMNLSMVNHSNSKRIWERYTCPNLMLRRHRARQLTLKFRRSRLKMQKRPQNQPKNQFVKHSSCKMWPVARVSLFKMIKRSHKSIRVQRMRNHRRIMMQPTIHLMRLNSSRISYRWNNNRTWNRPRYWSKLILVPLAITPQTTKNRKRGRTRSRPNKAR